MSLSAFVYSQQLPVVDTNIVLKPIQKTVYWDPTNGDNTRDGSTMENAVKTWTRARDLCEWGTEGVDGGHFYNKIIIKAGTHYLTSTDRVYQTYNHSSEGGGNGNYRHHANKNIFKDISIAGEESAIPCVLDATNIGILGAGNGVIRLAGRHISIENITIQNSPGRGIDLRTDAGYINNPDARQNDVLIKNVTVKNASYFGISIERIDKAVINNCEVFNTCLNNENENSYNSFPSAVKCIYSTHIAFLNNKVYRNWGEGLNFNKSEYCLALDNVSYDNYGVNFYCDNAKNTILAGNLFYNDASDRTFWKKINATSTLKRAANNISVSNESYPVGQIDSENIFIFNNVCIRGPISFGYTNRNSGTNSYTNIYINNNTVIDAVADATLQISLLNLILSPNLPATFSNFNIQNNIFSMPAEKLALPGHLVELARTSQQDAALPSLDVNTANNYWSADPYKPGRYNFIEQADNSINTALPTTVTDLSTLSNINPANNNTLVLAAAHAGFITNDFFKIQRVLSPASNVGAIEYTAALPVKFDQISAIIKDGILNVKWSTLTEINSSHFLIELSRNGKDFTTIGKVDSRSGDDNSGQQYEFSIPLSSLGGGLMFAFAGLFSLLFAGKKMRKLSYAMLLFAAILFINGCRKDSDSLSYDKQSYFLRITQVDNDGIKNQSKVLSII